MKQPGKWIVAYLQIRPQGTTYEQLLDYIEAEYLTKEIADRVLKRTLKNMLRGKLISIENGNYYAPTEYKTEKYPHKIPLVIRAQIVEFAFSIGWEIQRYESLTNVNVLGWAYKLINPIGECVITSTKLDQLNDYLVDLFTGKN